METTSFKDKLLLTLNQASEYANIGIHKMREISKEHNEMTVFVGNKRMIKRSALEKFIEDAVYSI